MTKFTSRFKSEGTEKIYLLSYATVNSINMRQESLVSVDYKFKEILVLLSYM